MCNAWNHPPGCTCGWGGDGHLGKRSEGNAGRPFWDLYYYRDRYETYTNPNAKCPVCGASVYFYKSPYGGRVFFDELGPPWQKHPCTDNSQTYNVQMVEYYGYPMLNTSDWGSEGWMPAVAIEIGRLSQFHVEFEILTSRNNFFIDTLIYDNEFIEKIKSKKLILFFKDIDNEHFQINYYDTENDMTGVLTLEKRNMK